MHSDTGNARLCPQLILITVVVELLVDQNLGFPPGALANDVPTLATPYGTAVTLHSRAKIPKDYLEQRITN